MPVAITSVLNRKNGFALPAQNWRKSCGAAKARKATFVTKFLSVLKTLLGFVYSFVQSSTFIHGTLSNSPTLFVTTIKSFVIACAAISISYGPIGVPFFSR